MIRILLLVVIAVLTAPLAVGQEKTTQKKPETATSKSMSVYAPTDVTWQEGPASLPAGAKLAVLEGDLTKAGPFTMRLMVPDGYRVPPHSHGNIEHLTVVSGTFYVGMGEKFDESAGRELPAGSFAFMPAGMRHFAWTKGETVVQVHGVGPWSITYVNPTDDPRKSAAKTTVNKP